MFTKLNGQLMNECIAKLYYCNLCIIVIYVII